MKKLRLLMAFCALLLGWSNASAQKDVTSQYITNATLSDGTNGWTKTHTKTVVTNDPADAFSNSVRGNNTVGYASEAYAGWGSLIQTAYSMKQTITLPAGNYRLVCYAFFRQGAAYNTNASKSLAKLVAGSKKVDIKTLGSITASYYANSQADGANCFDSKMYRNVVEFTSDGTAIDIGVEGTFDEAKSWCIVGQFELFDLDDLASVSSPTDMTYAITNPGFEYRDLSGWTNNDNFWFPSNDNINNFSHIGYGWVEKWAGSNFPNATLSQTLTELPNGLYEITVLAQARGGNGFYVFANDDKTQITDRGDYSVRTTITDGTLTLGVKTISFQGDWTPVDNFRLKFYGDPLAAYQELLDAAVVSAQALIDGAAGTAISTTAKAAWQAVVDANDNDDSAFTEESQFSEAIANIEAANTNYQAMAAPYASFNALKTAANNIADVDYTETTSGSHSTFAGAISAQTSAADGATTVEGINTASSTLKTAIKTYINGAEPANENEYFDITCLMVNPDFENGVTGWTYAGDAPGVNWSNCEYYQHEFDINQTVSGLPTGSYSLSVQAFQRPGWAADVWAAYNGGTDNASSVLYINSITSKVKNIAADAQNEPKLGTDNWGNWPNDSRVGEEGSYKYLPNSQQGAKLYFDAGLYDATCAAVVTDADEGSLKLGFKSTKTHVDGDWTIFDNFRLYYYGGSLLVYYKQYLPQLRTEVSADLSNGAYANVLVSSEDEELDAALVAEPATETEAAYETVINNLLTAQTNFRAAAPSYDAMVAAKGYAELTEITANIGSGVFQYPTSITDKWTTYSSAKSAVDGYTFTTSSTAEGAQTLVNALDEAIADYNGITLNAPDPSKRYWITMHDAEKAWDGNAITFIAGGRSGEGDYNVQYLSAANANMNQALKFTAVDGKANTYKISGIRVADGTEQYLTGKLKGYSSGSNNQIRTTDDVSKALEITVQATTTDNQFKLINETGTEIARNSANPDNGVYADGNVDSYFTIAEASQATVDMTIDENVKYATRIFPFTPTTWPNGVTAYSCEETEGNVLSLVEVNEPVANTPYILYAENGSTGSVSGWGTAAATTATAGLLTGVYENTSAPVGSYVLQNNNSKVGFYVVADGKQPSVGAYRCYLTDGGNTARAAFFFRGDITGVENVEAATEATLKDGKYLENGKIVIVKNGVKYNAAGAQVK